MKILVYDFGYTISDILDSFKQLGITYRIFSYYFENKNDDDFFIHRFSKTINDDRYDAIFSVNYFPLIAECAYQNNLKYISWSYDNPLNVNKIEETLSYPTNYVFFFDKIQANHYAGLGFEHIYHLPLAANINRLNQIQLSASDHTKYDTDISFVGKLYDSDYGFLLKIMNDYQRGFIEGLVNVQQNLYGSYLLDDIITDDFISKINGYIKKSNPDSTFALTKSALTYAMSANITRNERLMILGILSRHHKLKLYSREEHEILKNAQFMGSCGYINEMPRIFKASKINLNITLKILQSGIPLRAIDIMGSGGFLLSNYQPELAEFFTDGIDVAMYDSIEDAIAKADYYLKHDDERNKIATLAHAKVAEYFNYESRIKDMFETAGI